jgi:hypothetical protein
MNIRTDIRWVSNTILLRLMAELRKRAEISPAPSELGLLEFAYCDAYPSWEAFAGVHLDSVTENWLQPIAAGMVDELFRKGDQFAFVELALPWRGIREALMETASYRATDAETGTSILVTLVKTHHGLDIRATACIRRPA